VRIDVDQFDGEVSVLGIGRHVKRYFNWSTNFETFLQRLRAVYEDIRPRLILPLIESSRCDRVSSAADIATIRRHRIHRIVCKRVGTIVGWRRVSQHAIARHRIRLAATRQEETERLRASRWPRI